ncbi:hypothetical protein LTS07_001609 [Exophiala sideris]|uniref:Reverse transcriptase domain-containing protein n=1 Tax=Exophiala sideris TaxID=1016849 RepID=A0ABR0JPA6_9EURO|nr:hypothetical protein LTS07_001609 [Exophiala sideris]KAK5044124.1 hypothetical protein LTR13_000480 [Exophiala sideris]KAK5067624.1 hypothetical protein LTR69_001613 [Exophiala sideris]KAK5184137.1 hypothetical protein LTR44_003643 [Eurotiomycetes sp. CCFEE 6388]
MASSTALPETLRSVTSTKIQELKRQREQYETGKKQILDEAYHCTDNLKRTKTLLHGACRQAGIPIIKDDSSKSEKFDSSNKSHRRCNQQLLLRQAEKDPAFASSLHEHAQFFSELVTEWLSASEEPESQVTAKEAIEGSSFESVGRKEMHDQRAEWESIVFSQSNVDQSRVKKYLQELFETDDSIRGPFKIIRKATTTICDTLWRDASLFDSAHLKTVIQGVLQTDLLSVEKASILKSFRSNKDVLQEVADVLNMRVASLENWQWSTTNGAISVQQRRQLNGKYRVFMDEDVLDALLLHAIGMKWAVHFKSCFTGFFGSFAWKTPGKNLPKIDQDRRVYFLGGDTGLAARVEEEGTRAYGDEEDDASSSTRKSPVETKQSLLHLLITEALIARHLRPGVPHAVIRSDFKWFGPSLPHETIFTVLEFFGVSETWLEFFRKFLQAPTRFIQDGPEGQVQIRQRGVPMSHALSDVFGEVMLFVMDFAVNRSTQSYLYRLHDDFWFWGTKSLCTRGWEAMTKFASTFGIEFNQDKTGSVIFDQDSVTQPESDSDIENDDEKGLTYTTRLPKGEVRWGFLRLDAARTRFVIDQTMVDEHITELQRQLAHCTSIFSYIQAYNAYLARFFSNNFGKPSFAFGREHIDDMIDTFARIQRAMFPEGLVTDYLAKLARDRFDVRDVPDGVWYWPVQMGGLELRNPVVSLYGVRESMRKSALDILATDLAADEVLYLSKKAAFERKSSIELRTARKTAGIGNIGDEFMSKQEYMRYREARSAYLGRAYDLLLITPEEFEIKTTNEITSWLDTLPSRARESRSSSSGIHQSFKSMKPYWRWILAVYGGQIVKKYGSVQMVDASQVPLGVISVMKSSKIRWQG